MALYVGGIKRKVILNGNVYSMNIYSSTPITNGIKLLTSEGYILVDLNGLYITAKDVEGYRVQIATFDDEILQDANESYLIVKEEDE
jgi:hypothetical protein